MKNMQNDLLHEALFEEKPILQFAENNCELLKTDRDHYFSKDLVFQKIGRNTT